jgi:hypothetical protein
VKSVSEVIMTAAAFQIRKERSLIPDRGGSGSRAGVRPERRPLFETGECGRLIGVEALSFPPFFSAVVP